MMASPRLPFARFALTKVEAIACTNSRLQCWLEAILAEKQRQPASSTLPPKSPKRGSTCACPHELPIAKRSRDSEKERGVLIYRFHSMDLSCKILYIVRRTPHPNTALPNIARLASRVWQLPQLSAFRQRTILRFIWQTKPHHVDTATDSAACAGADFLFEIVCHRCSNRKNMANVRWPASTASNVDASASSTALSLAVSLTGSLTGSWTCSLAGSASF